jgi:hypothetical protein
MQKLVSALKFLDHSCTLLGRRVCYRLVNDKVDIRSQSADFDPDSA